MSFNLLGLLAPLLVRFCGEGCRLVGGYLQKSEL